MGITGAVMVASHGAVNADQKIENENGILLAGHQCGGGGHCGGYAPSNSRGYISEADQAMKTAPASADTSDDAQFTSQLNEEGKATYGGLDAEGKALARKLASQSCKGKNDCKGLNSCKTSNNSCAGHGGCKGQSNCSFKDKNTAVKVAAMKMADKRASMSDPRGHTHQRVTGYDYNPNQR